MKNAIAVGIAVLILAGCATTKSGSGWTPVGGSRAEGFVTLSYEWDDLQLPAEEQWEGLLLAANRCADWGYFGAEPGNETRSCGKVDAGDCNSWIFTRDYQCLRGVQVLEFEI